VPLGHRFAVGTAFTSFKLPQRQALLVFGIIFGYKLAIKDEAAFGRYLEMANSFAHIKILEEKSEEELRKFIISDLKLTASIHVDLSKEQSILSSHLGSASEQNFEYYPAIKGYLGSLPKGESNELAISDLEWLENNYE